MKLILWMMALGIGLATQNAHAASMCNAGGADPLVCKSANGKFAFFIHPRFLLNDLSLNGFCNEAYMKYDGKELNGEPDGVSPKIPALENVQSVSAHYGVNGKLHDSTEVESFDTVIYFEFSPSGLRVISDKNPSFGEIGVAKDQKSARLNIIDYHSKVSRKVMLKCGESV